MPGLGQFVVHGPPGHTTFVALRNGPPNLQVFFSASDLGCFYITKTTLLDNQIRRDLPHEVCINHRDNVKIDERDLRFSPQQGRKWFQSCAYYV